ncbi:cobalt-precorrin-5B (C(1))-methyltransferase CbiD [Calothrix sp. 336/3]|uniref:cobalt-precorrin-5B (C(1))-methyltransferase CbiD n=1 Tax=Calothrix sp. 336/3 TaxID=1337936 RepID=UPI0004E385B5|nr:cobalt-precorrin-5B (C(1))-methyltransferase CbiD [Calothrix sp. 336/3]AKG23616.1 cobalt-precorrin-6A synthase [Calothrix sp. 336/3]
MSRSGYTLPVFATAAAVAALQLLREKQTINSVSIDLITPQSTVEIPVEQVAIIGSSTALGITRSDPGDNFDLTRHTPVWAMVELAKGEGETVKIQGGEGIGKILNQDNKAAIYSYAHSILRENLEKFLLPGEQVTVTIILPEGRSLAQRTSNAAFGVVEGLSLLGTTGISQPLTAPGQLAEFRSELQQKAREFDCLVFCIGENGRDLAQNMGINPLQIVKTANWLGAMLVEAALQDVKEILLFGYHGKLLKLAGGIFHTHHHLADGRREILTAHCARLGLPIEDIQVVFHSPTAEAALQHLRSLDAHLNTNWVEKIYTAIAQEIDTRSQEYIKNHIDSMDSLPVIGSLMFDRDRQVIVKSQLACFLIANLC